MYVLASALWAIMMIVGPTLCLVVFIIGTGLVVTISAWRLAGALGATPNVAAALALLALLNPWVYSQVVAGHVTGVLCYGLSIDIARMAIEKRLDALPLALRLAIILGQVQLFVVDMLALIVFCHRLRSVWIAIGLGLVVAAPFAVGIALDASTLASTPYVLAWQQVQSVPFDAAIRLDGYFANYTAPVETMFAIAGLLLFAAALVGAVLAMRRSKYAMLAIACACLLIIVTGTRGPLAFPYTYVVTHFVASGLFRELYFLLAFIAIAYIVFSAYAAVHYRLVGYGLTIAALFALVAWIAYPPSYWFVNSKSLPPVRVDPDVATRFALFPAIQPIATKGGGSGADPDVYIRGRAAPINSYVVSYPASAALAFASKGDFRWLEALSVGSVIDRPWFVTDSRTLAGQMTVNATARLGKTNVLKALPEVSQVAVPIAASVARGPDRDAVFVGDSRPDFGFEAEASPTQTYDERLDWVDSRFTFVAHPETSTGLGGVATSSARDISVQPTMAYLVAVSHGKLVDQRGVVVARAPGFQWVTLARDVTALRCQGFCAIIGHAHKVPLLPVEGPVTTARPLEFERPIDWMLFVRYPARGSRAALRFNEAYDAGWLAWGGSPLQHVRLDGIANGWIVPKTIGGTIVIVHIVSLIQAILECIALAIVSVISIIHLRRAVR